jgi:hypothetical protein
LPPTCRHDQHPDKCPECSSRRKFFGGGRTAQGENWNDKLTRIKKKATALSEQHGLAHGYRSGLEFKVGKTLQDSEVPFEFETVKLKWVPLPTEHTYNPDFILKRKDGTMLLIESKGRFMPDDMAKHLAVKQQHPDVEVVFVFQNKNTWFRKAKTRSYAKWCEENGFRYCDMKEFHIKLKEWM